VRRVNWLATIGLAAVVCALALPAYAQDHSEVQSFRVAGEPVQQGGSGGTAANGGDLWIELSCDGGAWADDIDDDWVYLQMWLFVEGQQVAYNIFPARGESYGNLTVSVRASTVDRRVECDVSGSYSSASASGTILGSGPGSLNVKVDAFIPMEYVPNPMSTDHIFEGDNRWFDYADVSSRLYSIIDLLNPAVNDGYVLDGPFDEAGLTVEYDVETSVREECGYHICDDARNDWTWDNTLKTRWAFADVSSSCDNVQNLGPGPGYSRQSWHCVGAGNNPLVFASPDIDWDLTFTFTYGFNKVEYVIDGCRDGFPAYEAYGNGTPMLQAPDNGNVFSLYPPCDQTVQTAGVIQ